LCAGGLCAGLLAAITVLAFRADPPREFASIACAFDIALQLAFGASSLWMVHSSGLASRSQPFIDHGSPSLTSLGKVAAWLVVYLGGWYVGKWTGNFSLLLFILTMVTLAYWLAERFYFAPARGRAAQTLEQQDAIRRDELAKKGIAKVDGDVAQAREALLMQPWWLD